MKHYERYRWDGQVTVFALMIFMVVLSVLIGQYRSALFYACYTDANTAARLSADAFLESSGNSPARETMSNAYVFSRSARSSIVKSIGNP